MIAFRKADRCDIKDLLELKNESWFGTHTVTFANTISQEKWLEKISLETHCPRDLVLIANCTTEHTVFDGGMNIGVFKILNIDWQNRKAEVGWDIYKEYRGKGFGKEIVKTGIDYAFKMLNLRRLDAQILCTNEASIKCAKHAGFALEGVQKQAIFKNGEYIDNLLFGVTNAKNT
jgi:RimJ/RimL family protein N-acetyltransferase